MLLLKQSVNQSVVRPLKLWPHTSPSVGTTCHVVCLVLFQLWSNLIHAEKKQPWLLLLKLHTYSTLGFPYGEQIDCVWLCCGQFTDRINFLLSWGQIVFSYYAFKVKGRVMIFILFLDAHCTVQAVEGFFHRMNRPGFRFFFFLHSSLMLLTHSNYFF